MTRNILSLKPATSLYGIHDPSAAVFLDGELRFAVEEERFSRSKHAENTFPSQAIEACLEYTNTSFADIDTIILPYIPARRRRLIPNQVRQLLAEDKHVAGKIRQFERLVEWHLEAHVLPKHDVRQRLARIDSPVPPIELKSHHRCHAASAFYPSGFSEALVLTLDGQGENDSSVVWRGDENGLERLKTYSSPNSLGFFYSVVTEFLGYRAFNGEGKVMGLAPYGSHNPEIDSALRSKLEFGANYDVTWLTSFGIDKGVARLERLLGEPRNERVDTVRDWYADVAHTAQKLLEETVIRITEKHFPEVDGRNVCLAGGVALNCKMNGKIRELDSVDEVFIQPIAHDAGLTVGAGFSELGTATTSTMEDVYLGPSYESSEVTAFLDEANLEYEPFDERYSWLANRLADGSLVGWFQDRLEMGPRALGNRSILADPRTVDSRDRVNRKVKHREGWRPFAPSMLLEAADEYLIGATEAPFMIQTFDVADKKRDEIEGVVHPADGSTRPQTVTNEQNPKFYKLIGAFEEATGVPVLLNTSFNDHGEPIVNKPAEAVKDFFAMGLDILVLGETVLEKPASR